MKSRNVLLPLLLLWTASLACNLPSNIPTQAPSSDIEPTFTSIPSATPGADAALACSPSVKTTTVANVRNGPGQTYAVIGSLPLGGTAPVTGKSADGAWWYIEFAAGEAGHAWIAGIVTTASCIPETLAIIPAPPAPVAAATSAPSSSAPVSESSDSPPESSEGSMPTEAPTSPFIIYLLPPILPAVDLQITGFSNSTAAGGRACNLLLIHVTTTMPDTFRGNFEYKVWMDGTYVAGANVPTYPGVATYTVPYYVLPIATLTDSTSFHVKVDTTNAISETDEGNNEMTLLWGAMNRC